ncbi:uncharacterized protein BT62DRAFT_932022 [Guyanagaster necrorhizus]|uniref:Uncharacterized protein n=1 Tax=Guyanagaster necrorhizus TaxID=856835 RepID=A0A9P8ASW3_9AGAR|nr:uncharacterized protein BT62DRAFT_932022 [Guyanagaster necrorhizus MCA 3950]KAG7446585.1 hypothetical protein BT62DRAFT_932022 [Guyanagaster necrorhizus MCA 3950]
MSKTPPPVYASSSVSTGIQLARDAELLINDFLPDSRSSADYAGPSQGIPLPLCIPQIATKFDSSFARGYNDVLAEAVDIPQAELLSFIDGLNLAMTASPPLRVVDTAGMIIGLIPYHWTIIASAAMQTAAQTGMRVLSKSLTDRYLRAANQRIFKPRGLSARLCTTNAMMKLISGEGGEAPKISKMNKIGRTVGTGLLYLPLPLASRIVRLIADKPEKIAPSEGSEKNLVLKRRLQLVEGLALPLQLDDIPPPQKPEGMMDKMNDYGVRFDKYRNNKKEKKNETRRRELARLESGGPDLSRRERLQRMRIEHNKRRPGLIGSITGPKETRLETRVANADLLEHWGTEKIVWIVIMNEEKDGEIEGVQIADSLDDEERIDDRVWNDIMVLEREELDEELLMEAETKKN